jgi:hypothetical protein
MSGDKRDPLDLRTRTRQLQHLEELLEDLEARRLYADHPDRLLFIECARGQIEEFRGRVRRLLERN